MNEYDSAREPARAKTAKDYLTDLLKTKEKTAKWHPVGEGGDSTAVFDPSYEQMIRNAIRYEYLRSLGGHWETECAVAGLSPEEYDALLDSQMPP